MNYGLYIHVPFCTFKCDYCNFYSISLNDNNIDSQYVNRYINKLEREINSRLDEFDNINVDTIYFGGGTPSVLTLEQVESVIELIRKKVSVLQNSEISIEINPEHVTGNRLTGLKTAGINRLTLGVQTLNNNYHEKIGRSSKICTEEILDVFFDINGITHCIDLITGIPGQKCSELIEDLNSVVKFKPDHLSVYLLSIEKNTKLYKRIGKTKAEDNLQRNIIEETMNYLIDKGYNHYEISNYALDKSESTHNLKYWKFMPYIGFGPGAHSFYNDKRYYNQMSVDEYISSDDYLLTEDNRDKISEVLEYILTGLRLMNGFSLSEMEKRIDYKIPESIIDRILALSRDGYVNFDYDKDRKIKLTEKGIYVADSVIYNLVEPILK